MHSTRRITATLAVLLSITAIASAQAPAKPLPAGILVDAHPAMWKLTGAKGTTIYVLGTVHVMRKEVVWETPKIKDALKSSSALYLEVADIDDAGIKAMQPMVIKLGMDQEHPLSTKISKEDFQLLDTAAKGLGAPGEQAFDPMQPWLVYMTLSAIPAMQAGYDPNSGIDKILQAEAKSANKPVRGFETAEDQLHFMAGFPTDLQVKLLHQTLVDLPESVKRMDEIVDDWTQGEVEKIGTAENDEFKTKYPDLYETLLVKRNRAFTDSLATLLKDPATGTIFVAMGAAHFAGDDSVLKMLATKGFSSTRIQ